MHPQPAFNTSPGNSSIRTIAELRRQGVLRDHGSTLQECNRELLRRIADGEQ